jgi:hypothetical protein
MKKEHISHFDMVIFFRYTIIIKYDVNYNLIICSLFPYGDYMLLKPQHILVIQDHLQEMCHIKGKL